MFGAELLKLKRSLSWAVVVLLPLALALAGAINSVASGSPLEGGWHTLWLRSTVFYGLFPLATGIAILASLVWRTEHRGSNWNALMSGPTSSLQITVAKTAVVAVLAMTMQLVMLLTILILGKLVFGLPGLLPAEYFGISVLIMLASLPVAALQSALAMFMRSFAASVAAAFVGAGLSSALLMGLGPLAMISPYALLTRTTQLGTGTFADSGHVTAWDDGLILALTALLTAGVVWLTSAQLDRRDTHT